MLSNFPLRLYLGNFFVAQCFVVLYEISVAFLTNELWKSWNSNHSWTITKETGTAFKRLARLIAISWLRSRMDDRKSHSCEQKFPLVCHRAERERNLCLTGDGIIVAVVSVCTVICCFFFYSRHDHCVP